MQPANKTETLALTEQKILENIRINLHQIMQTQSLTAEELSQRTGVRPDHLAGILSGTQAPSLSMVVKLAEALELSVDVLLRGRLDHLAQEFQALPVHEVDRQAARLLSAVFRATERSLNRKGDQPTLDAIIAWWKDTDGDLSHSAQMTPHFDLVSAANALTAVPRIHHVGALGLSATTLGSAENARLERFLETLSTSDLAELNGQIRSVAHTGVGMITPLRRIVPLLETNETVEVRFVRLMLPVKDTQGTQFVLNYSTLLSESMPSSTEGCMLK